MLFKALRAFRRTTDTQGTITAGRQFFLRQNGVKMVPEGSQNRASSESDAFKATKRHQIAPGSGFCQCCSSLLELPGDPEGLRKSIKNRLFAKKCVPDVLFFDVLCADKRLTRFFRILYRFFRKKSMKTWWQHQGIFSHHRLFCWTWRPSRNIVFYDTKATFSFFFFL